VGRVILGSRWTTHSAKHISYLCLFACRNIQLDSSVEALLLSVSFQASLSKLRLIIISSMTSATTPFFSQYSFATDYTCLMKASLFSPVISCIAPFVISSNFCSNKSAVTFLFCNKSFYFGPYKFDGIQVTHIWCPWGDKILSIL
jgi:hypothetical protein